MNHITTYKIFENSSSIKEETEELLANLTDEGHIIVVTLYGPDSESRFYSERPYLKIDIRNEKWPKHFKYEDIYSDINRMVDYLSDRYTLSYLLVYYLPKNSKPLDQIKKLNFGSQSSTSIKLPTIDSRPDNLHPSIKELEDTITDIVILLRKI